MNDPTETHRYVIAVLREGNGRGGSTFVHKQLRVGDIIEVSPPRNNFALIDDAPLHVFVAGGIGITPFISMAHHCRAHAIPVRLYYCAKTAKTTAFVAQLQGLLGDDLVVHFDDGDRAKSLDLAAIAKAHEGAQFYCCGPRGLMQAFTSVTSQLDVPLLTEDFNPAIANGDTITAAEGGFDIVLSQSDTTLHVSAGETILEALKRANIEVETSCEAGVCGTCVVNYSEGEPVHNDVVLMPDEQERSVALCVAGCRSKKLVLDL